MLGDSVWWVFVMLCGAMALMGERGVEGRLFSCKLIEERAKRCFRVVSGHLMMHGEVYSFVLYRAV